MGFFSRKLWDRSKTSSCELMSCHTRFQRGLVLLPAVQGCWNTQCSQPCPLLWACGQSPEAEADFGSSAKPNANSGTPTSSKPQGPLSDMGGPGCAAPKATWSSRDGGWGRCCPASGVGAAGGERQEGENGCRNPCTRSSRKSRQALQMPSLATLCPSLSTTDAVSVPGSETWGK